MTLPIPLCAVASRGDSGNPAIWAGIVGWQTTKDIPTQYVEEGVRIGDQTGRYGAAIDEASLSPWRFDRGGAFGTDNIVNGPMPKGTIGLPSVAANRGGYFPCCCAWYDGTYYWACNGSVTYRCSYSTRYVDGEYITTYIMSSGKSAYGRVYRINQVLRCTQQELDEFMRTWNPAETSVWLPWNVVLKVDRSNEYDWLEEEKTSLVSYDDIYDPEYVYDCFRDMCQSLCADSNISHMTWYNLPILKADPSVDPYPWEKAIHTLLYTYEFSDPELANATVGNTTHYRLIDKSASVWDRLEHRKVDGQQAVLVPRGGPYGTYMFEWLVQHAWMDAANSIPQANQNSIQNLMAAFELLASVRSGNVAEIPDILYDEWVAWTTSAKAYAKGVSNAWLRWRYEKSTTEMDINEYVKFGLDIIDRYNKQITSSRTHGHATYHAEDGSTYECNCSMTWSEKGLSGLSKFFHALWKTGLEPNAYVAWDFVPFSFIVDWFTPVGDVLETYSSMQYRNEAYYQFSDIVFSIRYRTGPIQNMYAEHYVRWVAERPPVVDESYWFDDGAATTSGTTKFKRVLDAGSLITGIAVR